MRRINCNLYPSGGHFFVESDGSKHRAGNWRAVIKKVTEYRQRARLPMGDVEQEVMAQACARNPSICYDDRRAPPPPQPKSVTIKAQVLKWLFGFQQLKEREPLNYVSTAESVARAAICAKCPLNTPLGVKTCATCKETLKEYRKQLLGGARARDSRLGGCAVLGSDLVTAVHLDELRVENPALPPHCWRKKAI